MKGDSLIKPSAVWHLASPQVLAAANTEYGTLFLVSFSLKNVLCAFCILVNVT